MNHCRKFNILLLVVLTLFNLFSCYPNHEKFLYENTVNFYSHEYLRQLSRERPTENIIFSPLSIYVCYTMLMAGARGHTWHDLMFSLRLDIISKEEEEREKITKAFAELSRNYSKKSSVLSSNLLAISNKLEVKPEYEKIVNEQYLAELMKANFKNPQEVQKKINSWVAKKTKKLIPKMLEEPPEPDTELILLNAVYFKGIWNRSFIVNNTLQETFTNADGSRSKVNFMHDKSKGKSPLLLRYTDNACAGPRYCEAIELPYKDSMSMIIALPYKDIGLHRVIEAYGLLSAVYTVLKSKRKRIQTLSIPKFKLSKEYDMEEFVNLKEISSDKADFSGISDKPLKVSKSIHKAAIEVNEEGTHAAAATSVEMVLKAAKMPGISFVVNRPFAFFIYDKSKEMILFLGVINKL